MRKGFCLVTGVLLAILACSAPSTYAGPEHELQTLFRLRHREYRSYVTTGPEVRERVLLYRLMFHSSDNRRVRRMLANTLTRGRGWQVDIDTPKQRIEYNRGHESVEYLSTAKYNWAERGVDNPAWYPNGKPPPRAYHGGCVVQYFKTRR